MWQKAKITSDAPELKPLGEEVWVEVSRPILIRDSARVFNQPTRRWRKIREAIDKEALGYRTNYEGKNNPIFINRRAVELLNEFAESVEIAPCPKLSNQLHS